MVGAIFGDSGVSGNHSLKDLNKSDTFEESLLKFIIFSLPDRSQERVMGETLRKNRIPDRSRYNRAVRQYLHRTATARGQPEGR
jgi:hypothetical protein